MTEQLVDPAEAAFWASDPSILTEPEPLPEPEHRDRLALEIAAAFLVCARLVRLSLAAKGTGDDPRDAVDKAWDAVMPLFAGLTSTALGDTLRLDAATAGVSALSITDVSGTYARGLGAYLGATSGDAFIGAFERQLAGKWSSAVAWARAAAGYGLDRPSYGAYLANAATSTEELVPAGAQAIADAGLLDRAQLVGESEAHTSGEAAKALHWRQLYLTGALPSTTRRQWLAANPEDDCATCGALDEQLAALDEPFVIDGYEMWSPQAHPHCRCTLQLVDEVGKAYNPNEAREPRGGAHPGRWAKVAEANPVAEEMMAQARALTEEETKTATPSIFGARTDLFGPAPLFAAKATNAFAGQLFAGKSTDAFAAPGKATTVFRRPTPVIRVRQTYIMAPPPTMPKIGRPYYLPVDHYAAEVDEHSVNMLLGMNADADFDVAHPTTGGHLIARATPLPWEVLSYDDVALGRVKGKVIHRAYGAEVVPRVTRPEVKTLWEILLPDAYRGWHDAIRNAQDIDDDKLGIVADLDPVDRENIAVMADYHDWTDDEDLTAKIMKAAQDLGTGNDSLACAYADYVVYNRPDLLGETGKEIEAHLAVADQEGIDFGARPVDQVMSFGSGFHPGTRTDSSEADPRGKFIVTGLDYRSAIHDMGLGAPPLNIGLQIAHVQPFVPRSEPFWPRDAKTRPPASPM